MTNDDEFVAGMLIISAVELAQDDEYHPEAKALWDWFHKIHDENGAIATECVLCGREVDLAPEDISPQEVTIRTPDKMLFIKLPDENPVMRGVFCEDCANLPDLFGLVARHFKGTPIS